MPRGVSPNPECQMVIKILANNSENDKSANFLT